MCWRTIPKPCCGSWMRFQEIGCLRQKPKGVASDSIANSNPERGVEKWIARGNCARHDRASCDGGSVLQDRVSTGTAGAKRLCPLVRAHDVPGLRERAEDAAYQADQFERRSVEWVDDVRRNELLRGGALECAGTGVVA